MANLLGIQIIGALFGIFMLYYSFIQYKKKQFRGKEYAFWSIVWILFMLIAIFPDILDPVLKSVGVLRALDLLIITGFMFLIGITFYTYTIVKKDNKKIEEIVRKIALEKK